MSKKEEVGICVDINKHHYFFPFAKLDEKSTGEQYLIPNNPDGDHFSFHKSGTIHFKDMKNQNTIPIDISDFTDPIENSFNDIIEFLEMIERERRNPEFREAMKYVAMFIRCYKFKCENEKCPNSRGLSFDFDLFLETIIQISNEMKENIIANPEEEEDEMEEETTFQRLFNNYLPDLAEFQCQSCKDRPIIHKSHSKFKMRKCHLCNGYGIDFGKIKKYKIN